VIPGVILAAGLSSRMGRPKALLPVGDGGPTFVAHLSTALLDGGVADVIVVARPEDAALAEAVAGLGARVRIVTNPHADRGQLSSVLAGLNAADRPGVHAVLVTPVDVPLIRADTVQRLLAEFANRHVPVARATHLGRHGHPVIFGRAVFDALRHADERVGAKAIVQSHAHEAIDVDVDDPGVLHDIDEPGDYTRLIDQGTKEQEH
jgi:molybdenum cofactor cytidylyltransferase